MRGRVSTGRRSTSDKDKNNIAFSCDIDVTTVHILEGYFATGLRKRQIDESGTIDTQRYGIYPPKSYHQECLSCKELK